MISPALIVATARAWIGTPYMHAQTARHIGCDCLGLVRGVWRDLYGEEPEAPPPYSSSWRDGSSQETLLEAAGRHLVDATGESYQPGDALVFRWRPNLPARHCGIYAGDGRLIHAYEGAGAVAEVNLGLWDRRLAGVFRFPEVA